MYIPTFVLVFMFVIALNHSAFHFEGPSAETLFVVIKSILYYSIIIAMLVVGLVYGM